MKKLNTDLSQKPAPVSLLDVENKAVKLEFSGAEISSDGGLLFLREVENQIGLIHAFAEIIKDTRDPRYVKHAITELLLQRIGQIACGYEDANDSDELRNDPIFKMFAGRKPESDAALASQPTHSRLENAISRKTLYKLAYLFVEQFIGSYEKPPKVIVLDVDDTDDYVHGHQQLALFNGYFDHHCFMPLHIYEGLSGKLITTILRPGKRATGKGYLAILKRLIKRLKAAWPNTVIVLRTDSHFACPEIMHWCSERSHVHFVQGLAANARLKALAKAVVERAKARYQATGEPVRLFHSIRYKAQSWQHYFRVIIKVEYTKLGENVRFIVTDLERAGAKILYQQVYCHRAKAELCIKEHKLHLKSDRTSCHRFLANQFRLFLHSAAYVLLHAFRANMLKHTQWARATFKTIQLRLIKIAARVYELKTRIKVELPQATPVKPELLRCGQLFERLRAQPEFG